MEYNAWDTMLQLRRHTLPCGSLFRLLHAQAGSLTICSLRLPSLRAEHILIAPCLWSLLGCRLRHFAQKDVHIQPLGNVMLA